MKSNGKKRLWAAVLCMALAVGLCSPVFADDCCRLPPATNLIYEGIDVSVYQGNIDFYEVRRAGIEVVYIRAGYGSSYTDPWFEANWEKAHAAGLRVGFYYYVTARTRAEAEQQAARFASLIANKAYTARPAMDYESLDSLSRAEVNACALAFLETLAARTGIEPLVYTDDYRARTLWSDAVAKYPAWIADYDNAENPPAGGVWKAWSGFQYTDEGRISGIPDRVDRDRFTSAVLLSGTKQSSDSSSAAEGLDSAENGTSANATAALRANGAESETGKVPSASNVPQTVSDTTPAATAPQNTSAENLITAAAASTETRYVVQQGDTVRSVAEAHGISAAALVARSGIPERESSGRSAYGGIPRMSGSIISAATGGTAGTPAAGAGTGPLFSNNIGTQTALLPGTVLYIPAANQTLALHIATTGETLARIAPRYGLTASALSRLNGVSALAPLSPGQRVLLPA